MSIKRRITTSMLVKYAFADGTLREHYRQGMILWLSLHKSERLWMGSAE